MFKCFGKMTVLLWALFAAQVVHAAANPPATPQATPQAGYDGALGTVSYPLVTAVAFMFDVGPNTSPPACALPNQGALYRWAVDLSTPGGVAQMKLIMTAYSSGWQVQVFGAGTCNVAGQTEDVSYVFINR